MAPSLDEVLQAGMSSLVKPCGSILMLIEIQLIQASAAHRESNLLIFSSFRRAERDLSLAMILTSKKPLTRLKRLHRTPAALSWLINAELEVGKALTA